MALGAFAQKGKPVQLTSSQTFKGFTKQGVMRIIKPIFLQEGTTLAADSADFNQNANTFDAFGNVVITQPNGTTIYADLLNYNGATRQAILTNNVRMNDRGTVLTTNFLTYNTGSRYGTYLNGGRIENQGDVLTSQNGYYFGSTQDAYFRYNVVVNTADATITTDTLKYNTGTRISYFYGPTNIKGKKDQTNLYTENGRYTSDGKAWFGKRNLYTDGSKSLKGDSLYYERGIGYGKALGHVTFIDTVQKSILRGDFGAYQEKDESAFVTGHAYVILETKQDSNKVDSIFMTADTLRTKLILLKSLKPANQEELKSDEEIAVEESPAEGSAENPPGGPTPPPATATAETNKPKEEIAATGQEESTKTEAPEKPAEEDKIKPEPKPEKKKKSKIFGLFKRQSKSQDSTTVKQSGKPATTEVEEQVIAKKDTVVKDSITLAREAKQKAYLDTARTRIVLAYHRVKIFKSDLQTKADSAFYSYGDSIIRCYKNPMIWTQGSQLSADTIFLRLKNQKLDNMLLQRNGFIASTELDSSKFNQVKGKVLTGIFKNNKLRQMFVDGNAESIYYTVEDSAYSGMNKSLSSRMRLEFAENKLKEVIIIRKPEAKYYPIDKVVKDEEILKGFIWKPNDRPRSKEEILGIKPAKKISPTKKSSPATKSTGNKAKKKS